MSEFQVVSLCDLTGNMVMPWAEAGYRCLCLDIAHSIRRERRVKMGSGSIVYRWSNVRSITPAELPTDPLVIFAFPPCTNLAVSGARDFQKKGIRGLIDGLELVESCRQLCEWSGAPWMLENPVSRLSSCWRKPDHLFQPWQFGDNYSKKTCIWSGGGFVMPPPAIDEKPQDCEERIWLMSPGHNRAALRSETPQGFANAVFEANK
jgi:hypothetical protein